MRYKIEAVLLGQTLTESGSSGRLVEAFGPQEGFLSIARTFTLFLQFPI